MRRAVRWCAGSRRHLIRLRFCLGDWGAWASRWQPWQRGLLPETHSSNSNSAQLQPETFQHLIYFQSRGRRGSSLRPETPENERAGSQAGKAPLCQRAPRDFKTWEALWSQFTFSYALKFVYLDFFFFEWKRLIGVLWAWGSRKLIKRTLNFRNRLYSFQSSKLKQEDTRLVTAGFQTKLNLLSSSHTLWPSQMRSIYRHVTLMSSLTNSCVAFLAWTRKDRNKKK